MTTTNHVGHAPGECERCDAADAIIEQLDAAPCKLKCAMLESCTRLVTHIDDKGYVYCTSHGEQRKAVRRCRALRSNEVSKLLNNQPIKY